MTEVRCHPLLPHTGMKDLELAAEVHPTAVRVGYSNYKSTDGLIVPADLKPVCAGQDHAGQCEAAEFFGKLRAQGRLPREYPIPYRFQGCLYAHSQP